MLAIDQGLYLIHCAIIWGSMVPARITSLCIKTYLTER